MLLGLDLGTTSCKAAVVTLEGKEIAHGQSPLGWTMVPTGAEIAPAGLLPEPAFAGTPLGTVGDALPRARGAVLAVGGHDHLSAAVGAGAVGEGEVLDSWGTAEALIRSVAPLTPERVAQAVDDEIM